MTARSVPHELIPSHTLPAPTYRDLPDAPSWVRLIGPSILLLGLSIGSGEFILWPHITYRFGFVVFWACMLGVTTQFFINMEIERWTLATGETAVTGFCRLWKHWAWIFLLCNVVPWVWPGWASGAATMLSWEIGGDEGARVIYSIAGLIVVGLALTLGPVVYRTVFIIQSALVAVVVVLLVVLVALIVKAEHVVAMLKGTVNFGYIPPDIELPLLLGAIAFAGAGGSMNLAQSDFVRDKGYGMGRFIGRITSPLTGEDEVVADIGYHFEHTEENMGRWKAWWRAANLEHIVSFYVLAVLSLILLSLISYSTSRGATELGTGFDFVRAEGIYIGEHFGIGFQRLFNWMGIAILLTTELGVVDACARISTGIIKVNWLRDNERWTDSRLYFALLWAQILLGCLIMLSDLNQPLVLLVLSACMNGGVMLLYSVLLLWTNKRVLKGKIAMGPVRFLTMLWALGFFGYFTWITLIHQMPKLWN